MIVMSAVAVSGHRLIMRGMNNRRVAMNRRGVTVIARVIVVAMLHRIAARMARMRAIQSNRAGEDRTEQRQEYKSLNHNKISPSSD